MAGEAREEFAAFVPSGDLASFAAQLPKSLKQNFTGTMALLRDPRFQNLMTGYKRKERVFIVSDSTQDEVSSTWLVKGTDGKQYKPDDYLTIFSEYVKTHETDIDSIRILLNRPQDWGPEALAQLREKLKSAPQHFTLENLQKAHQVHYRKPLVDIISMVKHAADQQKPLLNAAERVGRVFAKLAVDRTFTHEQQQWLERIKVHLQENLSIDRDDFESQPVFANFGGWGRVSAVFKGQLPELVRNINQEIAA